MKTNAMRMLDQAKIKYVTLEYTIEKDLFSGEAVSNLLGLEYKMCYKTLAVKHEHDVFLCVISVSDELDLKKAAKALDVKNVEMIHVKDLLKTVGYERGSVSPIGAKKIKSIVFDDEINNFDEIEISGGMYGVGIKVNTKELVKYLNAKIEDVIKE